MVWRQNLASVEELARFQCLFPNPSWLTLEGDIWSPRTRSNMDRHLPVNGELRK